MVTVPKVKTTAQNSGIVTSHNALTTAQNRLGATLNSMLVVNKQFYESMLSGLKMKAAEQEEQKKQFQEEKANRKKGTGLGKLATNFVKASVLGMGDVFKGIMMLFESVFKAIVVQSVLRWLSNPANQKKIQVLIDTLAGFFKFLFEFVSGSISNTLSGLSDMLNGNLGFWDRLKGFGTFLVGFGGLLITFTFLKNPKALIGGVKFVLETVWKSVSSAVKLLRGRKKSFSGAASGAASAAAGAAPGKTPRPGGRAGGLMKGLAAGTAIFAPMIIGGMMGGGESEFMKSTQQSGGGTAPAGGGHGGGGTDGLSHLAEGGLVTRPTRALIGERGPELRMPANNSQRMSRAGIKPLGSLGGGDPKQTQKLSDLFMAPFKGIGAGILANIGNVVSGMGVPGQALTPILGQIVAPIANSFGVPPSLVKSLTAKTGISGGADRPGVTGKKKGDTGKLFGKGKAVNEDGTKFKRVGDTSVLGLLSNMIAAVQVVGNKIGGGSTTTKTQDQVQQTTQEQTSQSNPNNAATGSKTTQTASGKAGTGRMSQVAGTSAGVGVTDKNKNRQTGQLEQNHLDFKHDGQDYSVLINPNNGEYKLFKKHAGLLWTDQEISIGGPKGPKTGGLNEKLLQLTHNHVQHFFTENAPEKGLALKYIDQTMIDNYKKNKNKPKKSAGGWISGPMSGYPVSLSEGGGTDFIGHGTEWVGFKKASGGMASSAFVVPFNTPATKGSPNLTNRRLTEAAAGGYALPTFADGGQLDKKRKEHDKKASGDGRPLRKFSEGGKAILEGAKKIVGYGRGSSNKCAESTRAALSAAGHPAAGLRTKKGDLDSEGTKYNGPNFAASFAGSDMGTVIKSASALEAGDIVLWKGGNGYSAGAITHVGIKGEGNDLWHHGSGPGFRKASMYTSYGGQSFAAGIRLGGSGTIGSGAGGAGATAAQTSAAGGAQTLDSMDPIEAMKKAFDAFANPQTAIQDAGNAAGAKAFAPVSKGGANITAATTAVAFQKDLLKQNTLNTATAAVAGAKASTAAQKGQNPPSAPAPKPIILPGPSRNLDIANLNPRTSILAYSIGGIM
jgi:hypothetical protein